MKCIILVYDIYIVLNVYVVYLLIIRCLRLFWILKIMDDRWKRLYYNIVV